MKPRTHVDFCTSSGFRSSSQRLDAVALGQSTMTSDLSLRNQRKGLTQFGEEGGNPT